MPLLHEFQNIKNDPWIRLSDEQELHSDRMDFTIVNYQRFLARAEDGEQLPDGISVAPADDVNALLPFVAQLALICIEFPIFTDGRGYSHARLLRKRLGFIGELRAVGDIRADQILFMQRVGIDSFDCNKLPDSALLQQITSRYNYNYQPSYQLPIQNGS